MCDSARRLLESLNHMQTLIGGAGSLGWTAASEVTGSPQKENMRAWIGVCMDGNL